MIKSQRYTAYRQNQSKNDVLDLVFNELTWLRDKINDYIFDNLVCLITNKKVLLQQYAQFTSDIVPACNIQKEYQFQVRLYENSVKAQLKKVNLKIQKDIKVSRYKRKTKKHKVGDVKNFKLIKKPTNLSKFIKFLVYLNPEQFESAKNDWFQEALNYYESKPYFDRIVKISQQIRQRAISNVRKIEYKNEAVLKASKNYAQIVQDETNSLYNWWLYLKLKKGYGGIYLPLQTNFDYHTPDKLIAKEFLIFRRENKSKVHVVTTCNADDPDFVSECYRAVGLDVNLKHNFAVCSDGTEFDFDRNFIKKQIELLKQFDEIGYQNLDSGQLKKLKKIHRRLKGYFDYLCSNILRTLSNKGVTDLVVEDLLLKDKFGFCEEFGIKWIRLSKLLHLSSVKNALVRIGEKLGIRVHVTHASYSSQQCSDCGFIDRKNRLTQKDFKCVQCGYEDNADHNASMNLCNRLTSDVLKSKLHNADAFGRLVPKKLNRYKLKSLLEEFVSPISFSTNFVKTL